MLAAGSYTIQVTALADGFLSFFMLGMIGGVADSEREPATWQYLQRRGCERNPLRHHRHPNLGYPQEVLLYFAAGEGDSFYLSVSGETVSKYVNSDDVEMVRFFSEGGEYTFNVEPSARRSNF